MTCIKKSLASEKMKVSLKIEGKEIKMVPFVHDAFRDVIIAFTNNLKGQNGGKIEIVIE